MQEVQGLNDATRYVIKFNGEEDGSFYDGNRIEWPEVGGVIGAKVRKSVGS